MTPPRSAFISLLLACLLATPLLRAMSVRAPTFPELVAESATVVRARIVQVSSHAVFAPNGTRAIRTFVTCATLKAVKGKPSAEFTLSFLGGTEKGERWVVPGMPTFAVGEEAFIFTTGHESICPLVGAMHGRYRVLTAPDGRSYVARDNQVPLTSTDEVAAPMDGPTDIHTSGAGVVDALTPDDFEQRIATEVKTPSRPAAP